MGYRSDSIAVSRDMGPLRYCLQMGGVLRYKWTDNISLSSEHMGHQKYCNTNWRRIAIQIGGVLRWCFFEKYLVTRPKYPPYREIGVAMPLSHCVFCGIADYRCYTPSSFRKDGLSQSKDRPNKGCIAEKASL